MTSKISSIKRAIVFLSLGLFLSGFALTAFGQEEAKAPEAAKWKKKPNFDIKLGAFFPSSTASFRLDKTTADGQTIKGTEFSTDDIGIDPTATTFRGDAEIRIASWFGLGLGFYAINRNKTTVLNKDIQIGDTTFQVSQTVKTTFNTIYPNIDLKFYLINKPRLDFGVYVGAYWSTIKLQVEAQELDRRLLELRQASTIIPSIGLHFTYTLARNLYLYGKAGYFYLKPGKRTKFESGTININLDYYFYKFLGIGVRYEYNRFDLDLDVAKYHGMLKYRTDGAQVYLTIGF